jgi:hypothetical protein
VDIPNANRSKTAIHECFLAHVQCRKESGLVPLDSKAAKAHKNQLNSLFQKIGSGETLIAIYENAGKFAEEYSHAVANDQVNLHVAASFTAHLTCVHNALNDLAAYMRNHEKLTQDDVKAIKPSIIRLHSALDECKGYRWKRDCIVCLKMRAGELIRRLISGELTNYEVVQTSPEPLHTLSATALSK